MFDALETRQSNPILPAAIGIAILAAAGVWFWQNGGFTDPRAPTPEPVVERTGGPTDIEFGMASLLAQTPFLGDAFAKQLIGEMTLDGYYVEKEELYLLIDRNDRDDAALKEIWSTYLDDPQAVDVATAMPDGTQMIGNRTRSLNAKEHVWLRTKVDNLAAPPDRAFTFDVGSFAYDPTAEELTRFVKNETIFGGRLSLQPVGEASIVNYAVVVAKPAEASLTRLAERIVADTEGRVASVQAVLDAVADHVGAPDPATLTDRERLKRPSETLISGIADPSNKAVLLASLLLQLDEEVVLAYTRDDVWAAVHAADFPTGNGLRFDFEDEAWVLLEPNVEGFVIGETEVDGFDAPSLRWAQHLAGDAAMIDLASDRAVP